ncbi:MAG: lipase family protein [Frankia sp.]
MPPKKLPAGRPGDVLWSRPVPAAGSLKNLNVSVYEVLYLSTDALNRPDAVSGTVMLPRAGDLAPTPVLGWATGTHGLADSCAPSKAIAKGSDDWLDIFVLAAHHGWAVAATDYEGLGTPGNHTYSVGRSEGHAVLDAVRAALRLRGGGLAPAAKVAFWGYSQGGGAAAWAGELAPAYAPELHTVAVAAGGVPADLTKVSAAVDGATWAGAEFMAALGLDTAYPELNLDSYIRPAARAGLEKLRTSCVKEGIAANAGKHARDVFTVNLLNLDPWKKRLTENSLGATPPKAPIFLYHGEKDTVVAFGQAESLMRTYCAKGVDVTWLPIPGADHSVASYRETEVVAFLVDRFAGKPATSTC